MIVKDKQALSNGRAVQVGLSVIQTRDGKSVGNRDLMQGTFENLLEKGTFIIIPRRFQYALFWIVFYVLMLE